MTETHAPAPVTEPDEATRPSLPRSTWIPVVLGALLAGANVCIGFGLHFPVIVPGLGLFLLVGLPTALLIVKVDWRADHLAERLGYSLVTTLLLLMFGGLIINAVLPLV